MSSPPVRFSSHRVDGVVRSYVWFDDDAFDIEDLVDPSTNWPSPHGPITGSGHGRADAFVGALSKRDTRRDAPLDLLLRHIEPDRTAFDRLIESFRRRIDRHRPRTNRVGEWLPPLPAAGKILALGRTFPEHAREGGHAVREEPLVFAKLPEFQVGHDGTIRLPTDPEGRFDNEIEIAAVIGCNLYRGDAATADAAIVGYTISNDLTWRSKQKAAQADGHPWFAAKNMAHCHPVGPWIVPATLVGDVRARSLVCRIDGRVVQEASLAGLMRPVPELVAWLSRRWPLRAGDIVSLGTPKGLSSIEPGVVVEGEIEGIGILRTHVEGVAM